MHTLVYKQLQIHARAVLLHPQAPEPGFKLQNKRRNMRLRFSETEHPGNKRLMLCERVVTKTVCSDHIAR